MTVWLLGYTKRDPLLTYYGSSGWHAHEMLFGYMVAVMAGLLSIMMRNQSGEPGLRGMPLLGLVMLWLAGRALPVMPSVPPWLVALVDISFLPILTLALAVPLIRAGRKKELSMVLLLLILTAADVLVHLEWLGYVMDSARLGVVVAIYTMVLFVTLSAGRVMPWFIKPGLEQDKRTRRPVIDYASAISVVVLALADLFSPEVKIVIVCAMLAAAIHAWRWMHWLTRVDWSQALLWVLMAGYAWLIVGFVMTAISYGGHISHMIAFHALMVGGFGGLTLGMMAAVIAIDGDRLGDVEYRCGGTYCGALVILSLWPGHDHRRRGLMDYQLCIIFVGIRAHFHAGPGREAQGLIRENGAGVGVATGSMPF
jgi:uncharacterized protein involved in response to NO